MTRSQSLFGAPSFLYNTSLKKFSNQTNIKNFNNYIKFERFWLSLSLILPFIGPLLFILGFILTYLLHNNVNGYLFTGSLLSFISCLLSCLSYFQVYPWRRHPSIILFIICFLSLIFSFIIFIYALPKYTPDNFENDDDNSLKNYEKSNTCKFCSFIIEFIIFGRELYVLMLSFDLLTSVSNPFSSYKLQIKRYNIIVLLFSIIISILLVNYNNNKCVGKFLNNGMCWIKSSEISFEDICLWNYFLFWVLLFYFIGILILLYIFFNIKKRTIGKSFATRYGYMADTIRIIVSYFTYGIVVCFFYSLVSHQENKEIYKSIFAYSISSRGYFDSLVWFSAHGFVIKDSKILTNLTLFKFIIFDNNEKKTKIKKNINNNENIIESNNNNNQQDNQNNNNNINDNDNEDDYYDENDEENEEVVLKLRNIFNIKEFYYSFIQSYRDTIRIFSGCLRRPFMKKQNETKLSQDNLLKLNSESTNNSTFVNGSGIPNSASASPMHINNAVPFSSTTATTTILRIPSSTNSSTTPSIRQHSNSISQSPFVKNASSSFSDNSYSYTLRSLSSSYRSEYDGNNNFDYMKSIIMNQDDQLQQNLFFEGAEYDIENEEEGEVMNEAEEIDEETNDNNLDNKKNKKNKKKLTKIVQTAINDMDLSPQLNLYLRKEVLNLVTLGIKESVLRWNKKKNFIKKNFVSSNNLYEYNNSQDDVEENRKESEDLSKMDGNGLKNDQPEPYFPSYPSQPSLKNLYSNNDHQVQPTPTPKSHFTSYNFSLNQSYFYRDGGANKDTNINSDTSLSFTGSRIINSAVHGLLSAIGTHLPGEYGVDNLGRHLILPNTLSSAHLTPAGSVNKLMELHDQFEMNQNQQLPPNQQSIMYDYSMANKLDSNLLPPPPPAEVVFKVADTHVFRDFRPSTFSKLREMVGYNDDEYLNIISQPTQERLSEGRSGAFFFICGKGELVVKTVEPHEAKTLLSILDNYYSYLVERPDSLLVRFLGLHSIQMYGNEFTFVVMKNVFPTGINLSKKYDIKGSWVNRSGNSKPDPNSNKLSRCRLCNKEYYEGSNENCPLMVGPHEASITLKDNDTTSRIRLHYIYAQHLFDVICSDSKFLSDLNLMDYSLLIGVQYGRFEIHQEENNSEGGGCMFSPMIPIQNFNSINNNNSNSNDDTTNDDPNKKSSSFSTQFSPYNSPYNMLSNQNSTFYNNPKGSLSSVADLYSAIDPPSHFPAALVIAPQYYYFGIIDILQSWTWQKKLERFIKVYLFNQDSHGVSCVNPDFYRDRYQEKMLRIIQPVNPNITSENMKKDN